MNDKLISRISALLNKAESTSNEHEANAFMDKAQQLLTLHQIDEEIVRQHAHHDRQREAPTVRAVRIGLPGTLGLGNYAELFMAIGRANNLVHDIARNSTTVYAHGFPSDIDMSEALYASLMVQMSRATDAYMRKGEYKAEKVWRTKRIKEEDPWGYVRSVVTEGYFPVSGRTAKVAFQEAFAYQVGARLRKARNAAAAEATTASTGAELVLVGRQDAVQAYHDNVSRARKGSTYKGSTHAGSAHASGAGLEAGQRARLGTEQAIGGTRKAVTTGGGAA